MSKTSRRRNPRFTQLLLRWHRRIGLTAALFVILLVVTGIPLHHASQLGLTSSSVEQNWLLDSYGIELPTSFTSFSTSGKSVTQVEDAIYFEHHFVIDKQQSLKGAVQIAELVVVVTANDLLLLSSQGELIDHIPLTTRVVAVASDNQFIYVKDGQKVYRVTEAFDGIESIERPAEQFNWMQALQPDRQLQAIIASDFRARSLNWERVLLDLHSGRLFGSAGPWIMDIAALLFLIMAVTGVWIWSRRR